MNLPKELYEVYERALEKLDSIVPSDLGVCYITIDKFGNIQEHDDEIFDEGPFWYSYGQTNNVGYFYPDGAELPDPVWHLLKRRVEL